MKIAQIFGKINPPLGVAQYSGGTLQGFSNLLNNFVKMLIVGAGLYALINIVLAGYAFMSAGDDPKKMAAAWGKIWQTILGLTVAAGSFVLAAIFGALLFKDWEA